jgi:hypothetical protein
MKLKCGFLEMNDGLADLTWAQSQDRAVSNMAGGRARELGRPNNSLERREVSPPKGVKEAPKDARERNGGLVYLSSSHGGDMMFPAGNPLCVQSVEESFLADGGCEALG